eukprot:scaffold108934_cov26-Tisochrysis_lutea.AAC.1
MHTWEALAPASDGGHPFKTGLVTCLVELVKAPSALAMGRDEQLSHVLLPFEQELCRGTFSHPCCFLACHLFNVAHL